MNLTETESGFVIEGEVQCDSCKGTGLYRGVCERDGAAVVCVYCDGTGKTNVKHTYTKFDGRKKKDGVKRVYETACGTVITDKDITMDDGTVVHFSKFGVSYKDWLDGKAPKPIKELHCPYMHTDQGLQTDDVNDLHKTRCEKYLGFGYIRSCKCFDDKETCWKIYNGNK
jgi:hypothetical protein